jgi:predicted transcriptional regulator
MSVHTDIQIIRQGGHPAFVVVPYAQWQSITGQSLEEVLIPHEVVGYMAVENMSAIAAWRKYRGLSQSELGDKMGGLTQSSVAQLEAVGSKPQKRTLERVASALNIDLEQLKI